MNEDTTRDLPDSRSFEERIFDYLKAMEARMKAEMVEMEARITANLKAEMLGLEARIKADTLEMKIVINDINRRLTTLEEKVERRLYDTRPIWEGVQAQLVEVLARLTSIETRVEHIDAKIDIINKEILTMRADHLQLQRRVTRIEEDVQQPH